MVCVKCSVPKHNQDTVFLSIMCMTFCCVPHLICCAFNFHRLFSVAPVLICQEPGGLVGTPVTLYPPKMECWFGICVFIGLQGGPKMAPFLYALTLPDINRFSKLFHCQNQEKICKKILLQQASAVEETDWPHQMREFWTKRTKMRSTLGLCPDPIGSLSTPHACPLAVWRSSLQPGCKGQQGIWAQPHLKIWGIHPLFLLSSFLPLFSFAFSKINKVVQFRSHFTSHKVDQNCGYLTHPTWIFGGVWSTPRGGRTPSRLWNRGRKEGKWGRKKRKGGWERCMTSPMFGSGSRSLHCSIDMWFLAVSRLPSLSAC